MKLKIKLVLFTIMAIIILPSLVSAVNDVVLDSDVFFTLNTIDAVPVSTTITGFNGGQATNIEVQTNYIYVTLDIGSDITFKTTGSLYFNYQKMSGSDDYTISPVCVSNQITLIGTGATVLIKLEVTSTQTTCMNEQSGGSIYPASLSVSINNGAATTVNQQITLTLSAQNADLVMISNDQSFAGASWEPFSNLMDKEWILSSGYGLKTVYVKFKSPTENISSIITADIEYISSVTTPTEPETKPTQPEAVPQPEITPPSAGACTIDCNKTTYDLYIVNPNGTVREMNGNYAKIDKLGNDIFKVRFEDSGSDFDYNDITIKVDNSDCNKIKVTPLSLDAGWIHQIKIKLYYNGIYKQDILLWSDSHTAIGQTKEVDIKSYPDLCYEEVALAAGDLIKGSLDAVYYYSSDNKRHVFPNRNVYMSWYTDFNSVKRISDRQLASIQLGSNKTYQPGARMVKILSDPKVYAVDNGAVLRWVVSEEVAESLYGLNWAKYIDDISDSLFVDYSIGQPIYSNSDYLVDLSKFLIK